MASLAVWWDTEENGCNQPSANCIKQSAQTAGMTVVCLSSADIATGKLTNEQFSGFVVGGGELEIIEALGADGAANVQQFVANGGGYVGLCLGAYLACSLRLIDLVTSEGCGAAGGVLSGCFEGGFYKNHNFGDPEDRTWMVSGHAKVTWQHGPWPQPASVSVSHPPVLELAAQTTDANSALSVMSTFSAEQDDIDFLPFGPKCPLTEERFTEGLANMASKVAFASGRHGGGAVCVTGTHPEMSTGDENAKLLVWMLEFVTNTNIN